MAKQRVTMRDIAESMGISVAAVSLVMSDKPGVAPELREKVLQRSKELGYDTGKLKQRGASGGDLGFLLNREYMECGDPGYARIMSEAQRSAEELGYHLIVGALSREDAKAGKLPQFLTKDIRGILVDDGFGHDYVVDTLSTRVPVVLFGYDYPDAPLDCVKSEDFAGAFNAVKYLISCGHRRIALLNCLADHSSCMRRKYGYLAAMEQAQLPVGPELISPCVPETTPDMGYEGAMALFKQNQGKLDAVFCVTDNLAVGCLRAAWEFELRVPTDLSVMGYDNMSWSDQLVPPLTTMDTASQRVACHAVKRLVELVENRRRGIEEEPHSVSFPPQLIVRKSVAVKTAEPAVTKEKVKQS